MQPHDTYEYAIRPRGEDRGIARTVQILTPERVAEAVGLDVAGIETLIESGAVRTVAVGEERFITGHECNRLMDSLGIKPADRPKRESGRRHEL